MNYADAMKAGFLDEISKIAEAGKKKSKDLTKGQKALALFAGGPGGYFGALKGAPHGEALQGGVRGALGDSLGGIPGSLLGGAAGQALGGAIGGHQSGAAMAGNVLGSLAGRVGGGIAGYKVLTNKYNEPIEG